MDDCMAMNVPDIWVKVTARGKKPLVIGGIYREQHQLLQTIPNKTDDPKLQLDRWKVTLSGWKKASKNAKCVTIGDLNLDHCKWMDPTYRHHKLVQLTKDEVETRGFCQLINQPTRFWHGQTPSIIDHLWTNAPGCIMSTSNTPRSSSDHNTITAILRTKDRVVQQHNSRRRDRKKMDVENYKNKIKDIDWSEFFAENDINLLNNYFVEKVGAILEECAPMKTIQMRNFFRNWLTAEMKEEMEIRDKKRELARHSKSAAHWMDFKKSRNKCTKDLKNLRTEHFKKLYENFEHEHDVKNIFRTTKNLLNFQIWRKSS